LITFVLSLGGTTGFLWWEILTCHLFLWQIPQLAQAIMVPDKQFTGTYFHAKASEKLAQA
jgi:hypothetical protein